MEKMTNRPCLDMEKAIKILEEQFKIFGADSTSVRELLKPAFIGWFSRSMASAIFVFCKNSNGDWCVLASERGEEAADFRGFWNCPCGYLDFDETTINCARRECFEETGVELDSSKIELVGFEDDPVTANRQNVTFRFVCVIDDKITSDFSFSKKYNEGKEVGQIKWIPIERVPELSWAFNHEKRIDEIFNKYVDPDGWYYLKKKMGNFFRNVMTILFS